VTKQSFFKWFKRATLVLAIIPILMFLAFAGAVSLIDFNQYKPQIEDEVKSYTGRDFKIEGSIEVSILPFVFNVGELHLRNSDGFEAENLLSIKEVQVELSLASLFLDRELNVISLELIEPKLYLIKTDVGDNWSDIKALSQWLKAQNMPVLTRLNHPSEKALVTPQTASEWFESLEKVSVNLKSEIAVDESVKELDWAFTSLVVRNGEMQLEDKVQGFTETLSKVNVLTFDVMKGHPFDVSSDFIYQNSLSQRIYDVHLNTTLEIKNQFKVWQLTQWHGVFKLRLPEEKKVPEIRLTTQGERFELNIETQQLAVVKGRLHGLEAQVESSFSGQFGTHASLKGTAKIKSLNFKDWAYHLGLPLPEFVNPQALTEGNGEFEWQWDGHQLLLNEIDVQLDKSSIKGTLLHRFAADPITVFNLQLSGLNLDDYQAYFPQVSTVQSSPPQAAKVKSEDGVSLKKNAAIPSNQNGLTSAEAYFPIPLSDSFFRQFNARGQLQFEQFTIFNITADRLQIDLEAEQGLLQLAPFDGQFYQGELLSKLKVDLREEAPQFHWKGRLNEIDLGEAFSAKEQNSRFEGVMTSRFDLKTLGGDVESLKSQLNGLFSAEVSEAKIPGLDLNALLTGELNLKPSRTEFEQVSLLGRWSNGVYSARKLAASSERFSVSGAASFDLNRAWIDSQFMLLIDRPSKALSHVKGMSIPLTYKGSLSGEKSLKEKAAWQVDLASLMQGRDGQKNMLDQLMKLMP